MNYLGSRCRTALAGALAVFLLCASPATAGAQPAEGDVAAAARAYEEGLRAQLRRDYASAADLFELADRSAPSAPALRSAIRNHEAAGNGGRALTLATRALHRYPDDADTKSLAEAVIARVGPSFAMLSVGCSPACALVVDGHVADDAERAHHIYVPGGDHQVVASFGDGRTKAYALHVAAGGSAEVNLEAPPEAPPAAATVPAPGASSGAVASPAAPPIAHDRGLRRLPPWAVIASGGVTLVLGGVLVWSGVDTLQTRDRYLKAPSEPAFHDGAGRQLRTNVLIGAVSAVGAFTAVGALFFTDWHHGLRGKRAALVPGAAVGAGQASLSLSGAF